jgi:C4-dicarboxylate transporter DctM subunit
VTLIVFSFILTACGRGSSDGEASTTAADNDFTANWQFSITTSETSTWGKGASWFKEQLQARSGGRLDITIYPNEQLGGGNMTTSIEMNMNGSLDVLMLSTMTWTQFSDVFNSVNTPFLFSSYDDLYKKLYTNGAAEELAKVGNDLGVHVIAVTAGPFRGWSSNRGAYHTPADMSGQKFRTVGINMHVKFFESLGANPISMSFSEVYTSLQSGALDACEGIYDTYISGSLYEVQKYYTETQYVPDVALVTISDDVWQSMPDSDKELLLQLGKDYQDYFFEMAQAEEKTRKEEVKEVMEVYEMTDDEKQAFQDAAAPIYTEYKQYYSEELLKALEWPV